MISGIKIEKNYRNKNKNIYFFIDIIILFKLKYYPIKNL